MAVATGTVTFMDRSKERAGVSLYFPEASAANVEGLIDNIQPTTNGEIGALLAALSLATPVAWDLKAAQGSYTAVVPGNTYAQREIAVLFNYTDNVTGKAYHFTVPAPDWANLAAADSDNVDTTKALYTAFKAKFESVCRSPVGNAVTLVGGKLVGRNR